MPTRDELSDLLQEIDEQGMGLTRWEVEFIESMVERLELGQYFTPKQARQIERIHEKRLGTAERQDT